MKRKKSFLDFFFPPRCVLCDKVVPRGNWLCSKCKIDNLNVSDKKFAETKDKFKIECYSAFVYEADLRNAVIRYKFYNYREYAPFFAELMVQKLGDKINEYDIITCVPISEKRMKERGYNQSELIASNISQITGILYCSLIVKTVDNKAQRTLSLKDRLNNVKNVYRISDTDLKGKKILIVDDIVTTGATICECARILYKNNAKKVCGITLASAQNSIEN